VHETAAANHVSDSTFEADLARVRARLDGTGLTLVRQGPRIHARGSRDRQATPASARCSATSRRGGMLELEALRAAFPEVAEFRTAPRRGARRRGYAPNEYGLNDVLLHTAIALDRVGDEPLRSTTEASRGLPRRRRMARRPPVAASASTAADGGPLAEPPRPARRRALRHHGSGRPTSRT
jgi:lichenan operon transcriptional antiterminator